MKILDVLYYNYYLLVSRGNEHSVDPRLSTILTLSLSESLLLNGLYEYLMVHIYCDDLKPWSMFLVLLLIIALNYFFYIKMQRNNEVIRTQPCFFNDLKLSKALTVIFILFTTSLLFWGPIYLKSILDHCR